MGKRGWLVVLLSALVCLAALGAVVWSNIPEQPPSPKPTAATTPTNLPSIKGASVVAIPSGGPTKARGFPVPPWITAIMSPGALDQSWQFDIPTDQPARVIAFYKRILPRAGYRIRTDVTEQLGDEKVTWDLVFDGPAHGTIVRDQAAGTVFVDVRAVQQVQPK